MKNHRAVLALAILVGSLGSTSVWSQSAANSLSFGGKAVTIDSTSCSPENSADGKSRAMAAINMGSASNAVLQFSGLNPPGGAYTTVADSDALGAGKVIMAVVGKGFGGNFMAKPGQTVTITKTGSTYAAVFTEIAVLDMRTKAAVAKTVTGSFSCQ